MTFLFVSGIVSLSFLLSLFTFVFLIKSVSKRKYHLLLFFVTKFYFYSLQKLHKDRIRQKKKVDGRTVVGIFHPYCNAGGGGERVLWCAVRAIQAKYPDFHIAIYTGDKLNADKLLQNAKQRFNVDISSNNIEFVTLNNRNWVEASR